MWTHAVSNLQLVVVGIESRDIRLGNNRSIILSAVIGNCLTNLETLACTNAPSQFLELATFLDRGYDNNDPINTGVLS